ncbi:MAG: tRNA guanosine(34) transglycosylase Tgt [Desulfovibrionaceae bacterium]|nr:tRNA guanosine(34) transglycosylase Tgt [Desulfovibrionaceae bacterium]
MEQTVFTLCATCGSARAGVLTTAHGAIPTPIFMPVGTAASVKAIAPDDLAAIGAPIILGNTYHLHLRPGDELIARHGGLHAFSAYPGAFLTDSGGFQIFSLSTLRKLSEEGVRFRSHIDGSSHFFTPESVLGIQRNLGSDIMMVLDECVPFGADYAYTRDSMQLTCRWAKRSVRERERLYGEGISLGLLFGIVQGGFFSDLRAECAAQLSDLPFDGLAIGGLSVGEPKDVFCAHLAETADRLPQALPHYLMGVGTPLDVLRGIACGIDMFDCVLPTRNARNGTLYTSRGKINIKRREFAEDDSPLDPDCSCYTCRTFSKSYLRHLYVSHELLSFRLNSLHNLTYYLNLVREAREAILQGSFPSFYRQVASCYSDCEDNADTEKD